MKQKRLLIGSGIVVVVGAAVSAAWMAWLGIHGAERLGGPRQAIPQAKPASRPFEPGQADWPCWRGPTADGRSPVTGIRKDWTTESQYHDPAPPGIAFPTDHQV